MFWPFQASLLRTGAVPRGSTCGTCRAGARPRPPAAVQPMPLGPGGAGLSGTRRGKLTHSAALEEFSGTRPRRKTGRRTEAPWPAAPCCLLPLYPENKPRADHCIVPLHPGSSILLGRWASAMAPAPRPPRYAAPRAKPAGRATPKSVLILVEVSPRAQGAAPALLSGPRALPSLRGCQAWSV